MRSGPPSSNRRRRLPEEGTLEVFAADEQSAEPVDVHRWTQLAEQVLRAQGIRGEAELSLLFVTEEAISDLNLRFMETSGPTDVLAFPIDDDLVELGRFPDATTTGPDRPAPDPSDAPVLLGDVVICPAVAARNAPEHAGTYDDEIALLSSTASSTSSAWITPEAADEDAMRERERELLAEFHHPLQP